MVGRRLAFPVGQIGCLWYGWWLRSVVPKELQFFFSIPLHDVKTRLAKWFHTDEELIIAVAELIIWLTGIAVSTEHQLTITGQVLPLHLTGVDNSNAIGWHAKRRARPPVAGAILRSWEALMDWQLSDKH